MRGSVMCDFSLPGRPHMRDRPHHGRRKLASCFNWAKVSVIALVGFLGIQQLQSSALANLTSYSSHCSGIGTDKLIIEAFLKPQLDQLGIQCQMESIFSVASWTCFGSVCARVFSGLCPKPFSFMSSAYPT